MTTFTSKLKPGLVYVGGKSSFNSLPHTEAISNGLHGLIEKKPDSSDQQLIDEIVQEVESMEDSKEKMMLQALLGMVQNK